jgi:predicted ATPase/DNA-binding winged helix-turn-helix (wHTH) protein
LAQSYRFGDVEVRPAERQLLVEGRPAAVGARAFDVLLALIDHRDRVVSKNELLDMVWPGLVVEENNLQVQVSSLRKVLGPQAVATVPGRGYRFTLEVEPGDTASSASAPARSNNLPAQLNSFIGREREIGEIRHILANARLVTLTSVGGTGKTRLSLQVAAGVIDEYPDGVWFVELAPVDDERRVPQTVASVLGVKEEAGRPVSEALVKYVRDRHMLVILDNCEHLVQACADLAKQLLQAGAHLSILASSREHLHVAGEKIYPVPALTLPNWTRDTTIDALTNCEAVRLFIDRTVAVQPSFAVTPQNAAAVADICRRLDGIPLAIELAAARTSGLSVENIAARLTDCFRLLTGGDTTALPRQQTLRASIDWSYDLLTIPERVMLRRLAVFAGGWTVEAAEAVCAGGDVATSDVMDLLTRLVNKSLVALDAGGERYHLLETVRQYAHELLVSSGERDEVRRRHLEYCVAISEEARQALVGPRQGSWAARLDFERDNMLSAHTWCDEIDNGAELGLRLVYGLKMYWTFRGIMGLGHRITVEALARTRPDDRGAARCTALFDAGQMSCFMGRYAEARRYLDESLAIARILGDKQMIAQALQPLGLACLGEGDFRTAREHLEEALHLARDVGDKRDVAAALNAMAQLHRMEGDLDTAELLYEHVLAHARDLADAASIAIGLLNLAMVWISRASVPRARGLLLQALDIVDDIGSKPTGQGVLEGCAGLAALQKDWESTARFYGAAEAQSAKTGFHRDPTDDAFLAPRVAQARESLGDAAYADAENAGRALSYEEAMPEARAWLGRIAA